MRGILRLKKSQEVKDTLMQKIAELERQNKDTLALRVKEELLSLRNQLKLLDAHLAAQDNACETTGLLRLRDKTETNLEMVLAEHSEKNLSIEMNMGPYRGRYITKKLEVFEEYY